jgi:hypothetical protein
MVGLLFSQSQQVTLPECELQKDSRNMPSGVNVMILFIFFAFLAEKYHNIRFQDNLHYLPKIGQNRKK